MAQEQYTFNTGTPGTPVTTTGGPGDSTVSAVSAQLLYDAAGSHGQGAKSPSSSVQNGTITVTRTASPVWSMRIYFKVPTSISGDCRLAYANAGGSRAAHVAYHNASNTFRVYDSTSTSTQKWASAALTKGSWYCINLTGNRSTGVLKAPYYELGDGTPVENPSISGCNLLATDVDTLVMGKGTAAVTTELWWDEFAWDFATDTPIGPKATPPTVNVANTPGLSRIRAAGSVAGDGSTLSYAISPAPLVTLSAGDWLIQQTTLEQTFTVTVTQSGIDYPTTVTVPPLPVAGGVFYLPSMLVKQA